MNDKIFPIRPWFGDEPYVGDERVLQPAPERPPIEAPRDLGSPFGPHVQEATKLPYVLLYYGSPALERLTHSQALVYGFVRSFNETGRPCYASRTKIATALGLSPRQVTRLLHQLHTAGFLQVTPRTGATSLLEARRRF